MASTATASAPPSPASAPPPLESTRIDGAGRPVVVHTGFWGCGAFGGNRVVMAILQLAAARLAELDRLVFHTVHASGTKALSAATNVLHEELRDTPALDTRGLIARVIARGFEWGVGDGN